ncbi:MAG: histidine phosphatase family protein [Lachnospiraceae bacterium]|nr:histidine phosphatase family protein [Lachnospiraceae bacterium]
MRIVLVRHGEPNYEKDCLTELGKKHAKVAAQRLLEEGIDEIYSSPLGRARETAQAFSEASGIKDVKILDFMREIRFGKFGALYESGNPWEVAYKMAQRGIDLQRVDWRDYPEFRDNAAVVDIDNIFVKADEWLKELGYEREGSVYRCKRADDSEHTVALFSHGGSSTALLSRILNIPFPYLCITLGNILYTAVTSLRFDRRPGSLTVPMIEIASDSRHINGVE